MNPLHGMTLPCDASRASRRSLLRVGLASLVAAALLAAPLAHAQGYPDHPVKVIVPFAPAGPTDVVARLITQKLSERLKQQFYIENIAGAGGNLGAGVAARATPDGYSLMFTSQVNVINPHLYKSVPYDHFKDFQQVTRIATSPNVLVVHPLFHPLPGLTHFSLSCQAKERRAQDGDTPLNLCDRAGKEANSLRSDKPPSFFRPLTEIQGAI